VAPASAGMTNIRASTVPYTDDTTILKICQVKYIAENDKVCMVKSDINV